MGLSLRERLDTCASRGGLSTQDLATWFDLPYQTLRYYRAGTEPYAARRPQIEQRLVTLEKLVQRDKRFPIPLSVRASERKKYIAGVMKSVRRNR